jgi:hypothetical protein
MRTIVLLAVLALTSAVWAQAEKAEASKSEPASAEAASPAAEKTTARPVPVARKSRRHQDARHCLGKASNTEVIKCAEAYL